MKTRFGFLRRVWALALCAGAMVLMGGQGAWAMSCVQAAQIVDALYSTGAGAGTNGIPSDYKPPCNLSSGRIISIQATESGDAPNNGFQNAYGFVGCGQLGPQYHANPSYPRGSKTPLNIFGAGNEVQNLLRAGEYLCYLKNTLKTDRCDIISSAYNAGEGTIGDGIRLNKTYGKPDTFENIIAAGVPIYYGSGANGQAKTNEILGYVGCTCGGPFQKYTTSGRVCRPNGGGIGAIGTALLALDKINDVGAGVIQALANVVQTAVVLFNDHLGPALLSVVMVIYSIMALWAIAKLLMPFGRPGNAGQTMNGLLTLTGTVGIVALMLSNLSLLTSMVFFPIMSLMTELGDLSTSTFQNTAPVSSECAGTKDQSMSGDAGKDAKLLATRMTCTVEQSMQPLKQILRISMAILKRLEGDFNDTGMTVLSGVSNTINNTINNPIGFVTGAVVGDFDEKRKLAMQLIVLASAVPLAVMSATAILGIIATTAQAFWKIAFEFFKLAPAVAAFAFRPTRGVFTTSVKGWISPIMIFAVTYSMLGLSSGIVCNMEVANPASGPVTLCNESEGYVKGIAEAPYSLSAEFQEPKEGEAVFPVITKSIWISLAFFTLFINSSLRLAAKMDWVGGGGLADGLQKLVHNTLGNAEHYKTAGDRTVLLTSDVAQNAAAKAREAPKKKKDDDDDDKKSKKSSSGQQDSTNPANNIRDSDRLGSKAGNTDTAQNQSPSRQRTPVG